MHFVELFDDGLVDPHKEHALQRLIYGLLWWARLFALHSQGTSPSSGRGSSVFVCLPEVVTCTHTRMSFLMKVAFLAAWMACLMRAGAVRMHGGPGIVIQHGS